MQNVIDINGKRYDAVSGAFLGNRPAAPVTRSARPASRGIFVDGFRRTSRDRQAQAAPITPIPTHVAHPVMAVPAPKPRPTHQPAVHVKPHAPQPAKTLMRTAVKKPVINAPSVIKATTRTDILAKVPAQVVQPKLSHNKVDSSRQRRAERIIQSPAVMKYHAAIEQPMKATPQPLASPLQPQKPAVSTVGSQIDFVQPPVRSELRVARPGSNKPLRPIHQTAAIPVQPAPLHRDIFEQALAEATSHKQTYSKPKKRRLAGFAAASFIALALVGFIGYENWPYINTRIAASQAGIQAKLPGYNPTGFSLGNLAYGPGSVTMNYASENDSARSFDISQKASEWNSKALLDNFVASSAKSYQTIERAGRTIYLYGNNTATWVDNGIWYTVDGRDNLTSTHLLDVAMSF